MTEEANLKKQLERLQLELNKKEGEIGEYLDKIEYLEDEIMKLGELIPDKKSKKQSKKTKQSKLSIELEAKEREIRDLKDRMGFLRKEKIDAQKELESIKSSESTSSSVIRVEDLRNKQPLNILVKELQDKINKQDSLIKKLRRTGKGEEHDDLEIVDEKDREIENLKEEILKLKNFLEQSAITKDQKKSENITKDLLEDLQDTLTKVKKQNENLKKKLEKYEKKSSKGANDKALMSLTSELESKNVQIKELKELVSSLKESNEPLPLDQVVEELQNKLNKAKVRIQLLESQSKTPQIQTTPLQASSPGEIDGKLKIQREMASFLQQQLDEAKRNLNIKEEEISTIKNEAIRIKKSYEILENQMKEKDQKIYDLRNELNSFNIKNQTHSGLDQVEDHNIALRIEELKSIIEDLKKQNVQQRLEISQLRKSI